MQKQLILPMQHIEDFTIICMSKQLSTVLADVTEPACAKTKDVRLSKNIACTETKDAHTYIRNITYTCQKHLDLSQPLAPTVLTSDYSQTACPAVTTIWRRYEQQSMSSSS